jgi:exosortase
MANSTKSSSYVAASVALALVASLFFWSYWPALVELADEWAKNPLYSHGYLVPVFALVLLWLRRDLMPATLTPTWLALIPLALACGMRLWSAYFFFFWPERGSILVLGFAVALALGGWGALRWSWPSIVFLGFMLPFPGFVENLVMRPLQRIATVASTNILQTLGIFATADGNVIVLSEHQLGIVEACSGLRMLSTFVALTVGACFVLSRPWWQKIVIAASSIPIALFCNIARISATGIINEISGADLADKFHDYAGWIMMPLALVLLLLELKYLDFIFVQESAGKESESTPYSAAKKSPVLA